jgi:hypothetical protein
MDDINCGEYLFDNSVQAPAKLREKYIVIEKNKYIALCSTLVRVKKERDRLKETLRECQELIYWLNTLDLDYMRKVYESARFAIDSFKIANEAIKSDDKK